MHTAPSRAWSLRRLLKIELRTAFNNSLTVVQGNIEVAKVQLNRSEPAQEFLIKPRTPASARHSYRLSY